MRAPVLRFNQTFLIYSNLLYSPSAALLLCFSACGIDSGAVNSETPEEAELEPLWALLPVCVFLINFLVLPRSRNCSVAVPLAALVSTHSVCSGLSHFLLPPFTRLNIPFIVAVKQG